MYCKWRIEWQIVKNFVVIKLKENWWRILTIVDLFFHSCLHVRSVLEPVDVLVLAKNSSLLSHVHSVQPWRDSISYSRARRFPYKVSYKIMQQKRSRESTQASISGWAKGKGCESSQKLVNVKGSASDATIQLTVLISFWFVSIDMNTKHDRHISSPKTFSTPIRRRWMKMFCSCHKINLLLPLTMAYT